MNTKYYTYVVCLSFLISCKRIFSNHGLHHSSFITDYEERLTPYFSCNTNKYWPIKTKNEDGYFKVLAKDLQIMFFIFLHGPFVIKFIVYYLTNNKPCVFKNELFRSIEKTKLSDVYTQSIPKVSLYFMKKRGQIRRQVVFFGNFISFSICDRISELLSVCIAWLFLFNFFEKCLSLFLTIAFKLYLSLNKRVSYGSYFR